jgi:tRNA pseudouridine38-40 synthase
MRAYRVAYDGRAYHGYQRQPDVPTVEDALLNALEEAGLDFEGTPDGWAAAGRTDAGVSALAQTVAFDAPEWLDPRAFTARLPEDVHVWASASVPGDFHATHDAKRREYTYFLHAPEPAPDRAAEIEAALSGEHDFHNLAADEAGTVRDLTIESEREGPFRVIRVSTDGFPRQLVRRLVAVYDRVRRGQADLDFLERVLGPDTLPGPEGVEPAPPDPLVLTDVAYDVSFSSDPEAVEMAAGRIEDRIRRDRARAAVGETVLAGLSESGDNA